MKLLKHYVVDIVHRKVWPMAGLICRLRRQPNTCDTGFPPDVRACPRGMLSLVVHDWQC